MRDNIIVNGISEEMLASFLDGTASSAETQMILDALPHSAELKEIIGIAVGVDRDLALGFHAGDKLPVSAYAASSGDSNLCCWMCEKHILQRRGIPFNEESLLAHAEENKWHCESGTTLNNVGRYLEEVGATIERRFRCDIKDIVEALNDNKDVIVAVDGGELLGDLWLEVMEDIFDGEQPDHTVVVLSCDMDSGTISVYDPNSSNETDCYPLTQFMDAWNDSKNYMVTARITKN